MPQPTVKTAPQPGVLDRIKNWFGYGPLPPNVQEGMNLAAKEGIPTNNISQMGPIGRFFGSKANAVTNTFGGVELNTPKLAGYNPQEIADILTHENVHVNQMKGKNPIFEMYDRLTKSSQIPYGQRPEEMEAYAAENKRTRSRGAISMKPSFLNPGQWVTNRGDVNLPLSGAPDYQLQEYKNRIARMAGIQTGPSSKVK